MGAEHREENITPFSTPGFVERSEIAPTVTIPFHWGPWLDVTPMFTLRSTHYGGQLLMVNFLARDFSAPRKKSRSMCARQHSNACGATGDEMETRDRAGHRLQLVNGVNDFCRFIRFDEDETLTDTNEIEYGFTQRFYRRKVTVRPKN